MLKQISCPNWYSISSSCLTTPSFSYSFKKLYSVILTYFQRLILYFYNAYYTCKMDITKINFWFLKILSYLTNFLYRHIKQKYNYLSNKKFKWTIYFYIMKRDVFSKQTFCSLFLLVIIHVVEVVKITLSTLKLSKNLIRFSEVPFSTSKRFILWLLEGGL